MAILCRLSLPARHDQLVVFARVANAAALEAGLDEAQAGRIELAVDEACANIIDHAYDGALGNIDMEIVWEPQRALVVTLVDEGRSFRVPDPGGPNKPASIDEVGIGGLGLRIIRQAMSDVRWEFGIGLGEGRHGNRMTMTRDLTPLAAGPARS